MPHFKLEISHAPRRVCGVDEAGRGPWAGPVVAASVMFAGRKSIPRGLDDSKQLDKATREKLAQKLYAKPEEIFIGVGIASVEEIERFNIWGATALAMLRATQALPYTPEVALVDGKTKPKGFACDIQTIIGGDAISFSIAAASIIAKTHRDALMAEYAREYPQYGFERHVGYGTKAHQNALREHGVCPLHRRSWGPIRSLLEGRDMFAYLEEDVA